MSTPFYDLASLVVVPSGVKAGKVYAQKPMTTDGQLTFSRASTATRVNASGLIETVASNVPRLDYLGSSCPRLLLEPQRTNLYNYSEQINQWTATNATVTANYAVSPDGYTNADRVQFTAGGLVYVSGTGSAGENTLSVYAKATNGTSAKFRLFGNGNTTNSSDQTATSEWQRFTFTYTYSASSAGLKVATTGADDVIFYGFQHEIGAYATSYIPTLGAAVTRLAEQYDKVITSLVPDATTFTWEVDFIVPEFASGGGEIFGRNVAGTAQLRLYANNNTVIRFRVESGAQNYDTAVSVGDTAKCIFRCSSGVVSAFYNGVKIHTFTGVTMDFGKIQFGPPITSPKIIRSLVFPTALTDADCIALTA
jgi:hypothetical protein